ncbi:MAG: signal recognition particle-docking protein FtsY [Treponema sp.]|uniref:signal recognition particle-docking protein FtsY n=1 Tax=Treponema sp. TaxID=166 RepID=UPI001B68BA15|nr:signal recognition particle-docking protein FtsY [Treponema sp.]MBP5402918.1 signal recognition particle-docking protein FtsY [Treponema sp.]MBR5932972.1 signal recognition particle-docking protein FtsY [Treponema sp.]
MAKISFAQKIKNLFSLHKDRNEDFFDDLLDALIEGDTGAKTSMEIVDILSKKCREEKITDESEIMVTLKKILTEYVKGINIVPEKDKTNVWMVLGVNGVGKTTTCAKMANLLKNQGFENIVLSASDTFRAAAIEQLCYHGEKIGVRVVNHQSGSDPSSVVFDAAESIKAKGGGLVIADTAGRLHNKENLVHELEKIDRTCRQKADEGCYKKILVIDATTGQNALRQAEVFNEAVGLDAIVMTKYDSTAKGGVAISVCKDLKIPVFYVCTGETYADISLFKSEEYVNTFLGL